MPELISRDLISRFIFDKKHFSAQRNEAKPKAFFPARDGRTSVFLVAGLGEKEIWDIGVSFVAVLRQRELQARADLTEQDVSDVGLVVTPESSQHPLHANLEGWPREKEEKKGLAQDLAALATLVIHSPAL